MTNPNLQNLPPEMQARLADILHKQSHVPSTTANTPVDTGVQVNQVPVRAPSLMDHTIAFAKK